MVETAKPFNVVGPVSYTHLDVYKRQVEVRKTHRAGVKSSDLVIVKVRGDESLRGEAAGDAAHMSARETQVVQANEVRVGIIADGGHDQRVATQQFQVVGNVTRATAELTAHLGYQKGHVQNVNLLREDVILETIMENHDVVVGYGAADECGHRVFWGIEKVRGKIITPVQQRLMA